VKCAAANNAVDGAGGAGWSSWQSWSLDIGAPTVSAIGFGRLVDALRCHRARERVRIPAQWVTVRSHGQLIRVRTGAETKILTVVRCHARTVQRPLTVWVKAKQHGRAVLVKRTKVVRVVLLPHVVEHTTPRVRYGRGTTVNGWLGTTDGRALGGQAVSVLTVPTNGQGQFTTAAVVTTGADGSWTAAIAPGPSRLVEAMYGGSSSLEPAVSEPVQLFVPAEVRLHIKPRAVHWGGTIQISGRVLGGYIPGASQQLLRLRIGLDGIFSTVGIPDVQPDGRFRTTWTFTSGTGVVTYWFTVSTLNEADYPYAPGSSRRIYVTVGPR
jgi:hypothetical protein